MPRKPNSFLVIAAMLVSAQLSAQVISGQLNNNNGLLVPVKFFNEQDSTMIIYDTTDSNGFFSTRVFDLASANINCGFLNCDLLWVDTTFNIKTSNTVWMPDYCHSPAPPPPCPVSFTSRFCTCDQSFYLELDTTGLANKTLSWSFDDGQNSTEVFPVHYYQVNDLYNVCVTVIDAQQNNLCSFCHELGFDSEGHLFTREENSGFRISIVQPGYSPAVSPLSLISVYPNPVSDFAHFSYYADRQGKINISILNAIGQQVMTQEKETNTGLGSIDISVSSLQSGIYIMVMESESDVVFKRFMK